MKNLRVLELFGGIGACSKALERLNIEHKVVDYVEIDKYAVKSYNAIHNTNFEPQDITQWDKDIKVDLIMHGSPCQDFSLAGKQAGGDKDSGTRSSLLYETVRIVEKLKPKYVIWENVKNVLSQKHRHNFDNYLKEMEELGYTNYYQVLNAKDYGIPQNRERVFTVSILGEHETFTFPPKQELTLRLKDMLEDEVDEKYYLSKMVQQRFKLTDETFKKNIIGTTAPIFRTIGQRDSVYQTNSIMGSLVATDYKQPKQILIKEATKKGYKEAYDGDSVNLAYPESETRRGRVGEQVAQTLQCNDNMGVVERKICEQRADEGLRFFKNDMCGSLRTIDSCGDKRVIESNSQLEQLRIRKLTPKECFRLMGFDDEDFEKASQVNSNSQLYKQAGNSIVVNVLEAILTNLLK